MSCTLYYSLQPWTTTNAMQMRNRQQAVDLLIFFWQNRRRKKFILNVRRHMARKTKEKRKNERRRRRWRFTLEIWADRRIMNESMRKKNDLGWYVSFFLFLGFFSFLRYNLLNSHVIVTIIMNSKKKKKKRIILPRRGLFDL